MTIRIFCLITALLITGSGYSQYHNLVIQEQGECAISINALSHSGANTITNRHFFTLRQGGELSPEFVDELEQSLSDKTVIGGFNSGEILIKGQKIRCWGRDSLYLIAGVGYHQFQELGITSNAASLGLRGNHAFEGDTIEIGPLFYQSQRYHQWKLGLMKVSTGINGKFYAGFTLGISLGLQQMLIDIPRASLYTAPYGEYISLYTKMRFTRTDSPYRDPLFIQGAGPALDFFYAWVPDRGPSVSLSFTQLGFIIWNQKSYSYTRDTTFNFEGIVIDNIFNVPDTWNSNLDIDTIDGWFNRHGKPHRHYSSLPSTVHFTIMQKLPVHPLHIRGEVIYRHNTLMKPYFSASLDWKPLERLIISRSYSYGGYNGFTTGLAFQVNFVSDWWVTLGSNDLYPALSPDAKLNLHLFAGLQYRPKQRITE